ncbi:arginase [Streptacidiphilus sp. MAP12-33]|uniref:arginase family protein n=1 Tax=Streptacidiphilus sp. MAP12-33 TaxID=3156266 RepID=UPI003511D552
MAATTDRATADGDGAREGHLRLVWPQWQGADGAAVAAYVPEVPPDVARRGYAVGAAVLEATLPQHDGPTAAVPVLMSDVGLTQQDGVAAKAVVIEQLARALELIRRHAPSRITTLGGECSVSVAPFAELAHRYGEDLAVLWIDSHPDLFTPGGTYPGFHAMALATLTGHGDRDVLDLLPATVAPERVALVGVHSWFDDNLADAKAWGIQAFAPDALRGSSRPLLDWLAATGCSRVAVHFDVDTVDGEEVRLGLIAEPGGLTGVQVRRIVADIADVADVVGLTVAEFVPRQVMRLGQILGGFPLLSRPS